MEWWKSIDRWAFLTWQRFIYRTSISSITSVAEVWCRCRCRLKSDPNLAWGKTWKITTAKTIWIITVKIATANFKSSAVSFGDLLRFSQSVTGVSLYYAYIETYTHTYIALSCCNFIYEYCIIQYLSNLERERTDINKITR